MLFWWPTDTLCLSDFGRAVDLARLQICQMLPLNLHVKQSGMPVVSGGISRLRLIWNTLEPGWQPCSEHAC